jgi:amphi-Trp domain-containing protein
MSDDLFELDQNQRMSREQAAARLRALADSLERHNSVEVERSGKRVTIAVPDEVELGFEVEIGEENEIEVEIRW